MSKKSLKINELVDIEKLYSFEEALGVFQEVKSNNFDESVDIAINLGIDAGKSDQNVRGSVTFFCSVISCKTPCPFPKLVLTGSAEIKSIGKESA